ncbi:MAG TPA: NADH-quinone oxidoreductase subunit K [Kiritimatiellia bacterium]|nr:NADH-quinone oxidoreductase subunit K [Kiritimatiellia bacterium]HMO99269.1 NADH-quinone oxidoreductase subunit K [Kiritimatiellia bacterium]HMP97696.1 NADH-quinone oxidoreductase subunit K [Kiritimatiellia bacterium]
MTVVSIYGITGVLLFVMGVFGLMTQPHLLKKLLSLNIASAGVFLLMVALAYRGDKLDPVPHALVLTGIVISVSATAYAVALAARLQKITGSPTLEEPAVDEP